MTCYEKSMLRLIAGSGRSGTTWMLDVLAEANMLRPIFEPLHTDTSAVGQSFAHAYLTRGAECSELKEMFAAATDGRLRSIWTDYRIPPGALALHGKRIRSATEFRGLVHWWKELGKCYGRYRERIARPATLVKCIRANLMLDWIAGSLNARIVFVMRHPGAAVESRLRFAEHWDPFPLVKKYRDDAALMNGPLSAHAVWLNRDLSRTEALTAIWCIENLVPAAQATANGYLVTFYEELLEHPEVEWPRVVEGLNLVHVPSAQLLEEPSQQSTVRLRKSSTEGESYSRSYARWRESLSRRDLAQIDSVLQAFGVDFYTVSEDLPNVMAFTATFLSGSAETSRNSNTAGSLSRPN